jgi:Molecular chaperone (small heat shock protein)
MATKSLVRPGELFPGFFDDFFKPWNEWFNGGRSLTVPAVNISETNEDYKVSVAAPGLKKSDFDISIEGNVLSISCEKEESREDKDEKHTRREYNYSSFSRSFTLPDEVNKEKIDAVYEDGVLKLTLPKKDEVKKASVLKKINVK